MIDSVPGLPVDLLHGLRDPARFAAARPGPADIDAVLHDAERHGITALLADRLAGTGPSPLLERLRAASHSLAAWEMGHRRALLDAVSALSSAGVEPVLFKGTALAYSVYPNPVLRTRGDTDLIVPPHERERVTRVLQHSGFAAATDPMGRSIGYQTSFARQGPEGRCELDVHWQINNSQVLSRLFSYPELRADAVAVPALGPSVLAASPVHALLLACMHRAVHRHSPYYVADEALFGGNRLIWLYDLHLLAGSFQERDWQSFVACARAKGLLDTCCDGLVRARECFATRVPEPVWAALEAPRAREPAADYLRAGPLRQQWLDFQAVPGTSRKARYLRDLAFPPQDFMRAKFAGERGQWLPWLYARRAGTGVWRRLRGRVI